MDRRKYLKTLFVGTTGAGLLLQSCDTKKDTIASPPAPDFTIDRTPVELERDRKLMDEKFFDEHEITTISILSDIIIPKDDVSGSATDSGVPDFIAFIVKDMPEYQLPLRGGLKWLDLQCMKQFNADFATCTEQQRINIVDEIAFPEKAKDNPRLQQGVAFFNTMRDLTACGFFTSKMGIADLEYKGNRPNQWNGVPQEVLEQYGLKYDERTLDISVKYDS